MNERVLRILVFLFFLLLLTMPVTAEDLQLGINEALSRALEYNLDLKKAELNLEKSELQYKKNKASNLMQQSRYNQLQAEYSLKQAQNSYQNSKYEVLNNIVNQYKNIWTSKLDIRIKEKELELEKIRLENARAQYEMGDIGSVDLLEQENTYKNAENKFESTRDNYGQSLRSFKTALEVNVENNLVLDNLKYPDIWEITENEAVETALDKSVELKLIEENLKLVKLDLERAELSSSELDKKIKKIELELARIDQENKREDLISSTQEKVFQFNQSVKTLKLSRERLTGAEEKYNLRQEQYKAGLITKIDLLEYEINMLNSRYSYWSAIADYYQKELSLKQAMNLKTEVFENDISQEQN